MKFCMRGRVQEVVIYFKFHENRSRGLGAVEGRNRPLPLTWPMAYTTACTTVQALIKYSSCYVVVHLLCTVSSRPVWLLSLAAGVSWNNGYRKIFNACYSIVHVCH